MTPTPSLKTDLKAAWARLLEENPSMRIRNAADELGVSEAELLATQIGETVTRLEPKFGEILQDLEPLGRIMALTRNEEIVHERKGVYKNVEIMEGHGKMGLAVNDDIDMRIFFAVWRHAFAVTSEGARGLMRSIQFFDGNGNAIHKVFLTEESSVEEYNKLVEKYKSADQSQVLELEPRQEKPTDKPDSEIDVEGFRNAWAELKDTHDFFPLLKKFGVGRQQALRLAAWEMVQEVDSKSFRFVLEEARDRKLPIMVFVGNDGIIQIHTGEVEKVLDARGWFNVMDERFNLHIDQDKIAKAFIVKKPTVDGTVTSLEIFNQEGENVALFFGKRKPGIPESEDWRALVADLAAK